MVSQFYLENNMSRKISKDELNKLLDMAEEKALVISVANQKDINNICLCCDCCCGHLRMLKLGGNPADQVQSSFIAQINPDLCATCGTCMDRCQMEAIKEGEDNYEIETIRCIGCGVCVPTCPEEAISLIEKSNVKPVPENMFDTSMKIAAERGLM
jgi:MinD superfamily P-loop ATPase